MILELENDELLLVFDRRYGLSEFRAASRVLPGTYADELVERIYNYLFRYSRDLLAEYKKYYASEYADFAEFLYWKYSIERTVAQKIRNSVRDTTFVAYTKHLGLLLTEEIASSVLEHILAKLGERQSENTY